MTAPQPRRILLAKSASASRDAVELASHLRDTLAAAQAIFSPDGRWSRSWCRFFGLGTPELEARFRRNLEVACLAHDIGKANEDFQRMVSGEGKLQTLRHEHLSALFLHQPEIWAWLSASETIDAPIVVAAVLAHHVKAAMDPDIGVDEWAVPQNGGIGVRLWPGHPAIRSVLDEIAALAALPPAPPLPEESVWRYGGGTWQAARLSGLRAHKDLKRRIRKDPPYHAMLLAVKAALFAADAAGSGLVRTGKAVTDWIAENVQTPAIEKGEIRAKIVANRGDQITKRTGKPFALAPFQEGVASVGDRGLLLAACGAGKTLAAWRWAEAVSERHEIGKVVFLYPTRGTATEGFRDYVGWAPEADAELLTGTASYELEGMAANPSEATEGKVYRSEADERLFALGFWRKRFFSATVDQFLGFMEHQYAGLCMLPVLADAAVVIDEVHSFDKQMFRSLKAFLERFNGPVLCMTATLSPARRAQLEAAGLRAYPGPEDRALLAELEALERTPRYAIRRVPDASVAREEAILAVREGRRVLWVVNTVARCQALADELEKTLGRPVLAYHSRYRLQDRKEVHAATVDAFAWSDGAEPAIAITTQVCEMSLDLDADVLITEMAPISSLVQRMGRANRHLRPDRPTAQVLVYSAESHLPYTKAEIAAAEAFIGHVAGGNVSQADLAEALESYVPHEASQDGWSRFLSEAYGATPGGFREEDGFTVQAILDADAKAVARKLRAREPIDGFILQVPAKAVIKGPAPPGIPSWLSVVPADRYRTERGFCAP